MKKLFTSLAAVIFALGCVLGCVGCDGGPGKPTLDVQILAPYDGDEVRFFDTGTVSYDKQALELKSIAWKDDAGNTLKAADTFKADKTYTATIVVGAPADKELPTADTMEVSLREGFSFSDISAGEGTWQITLKASCVKPNVAEHEHSLVNDTACGRECSCFADGFSVTACKDCQYRVIEELKQYGEHAESEATAHEDATCEKAGKDTFTCPRCGKEYTKEIKALGHDWENVASKPATCTTNGEQIYKCKHCNKEKSESVPAYGHKWKRVGGGISSCTEHGYKTYQCEWCGKEKSEELPLAGHDWVIVYDVPPSCTWGGQTTYECTMCHKTETRYGEPLGHTVQKGFVCDRCGELVE